MTEEQKELAFLRYFYQNAGDAFGPASGDIYDMYKEWFERNNGYLPKGYERDTYDELL